jgi:cell division protein FtsW
MHQTVDRVFLAIVVILVIAGFFIFTSASLGLLARESARFGVIAFNQAFFGLFLGSIALLATARVHYSVWRKYAPYIFIAAIIITLLVFMPRLGFEYGGARRWLSIGPFSFQPAEFLKLAFVIYFSALAAALKKQKKIATFQYGMLPLMILLAIAGILLLLQPDTSSFLIIFLAALAVFITAGGKWQDIMATGIIVIALLALLIIFKPYVKERVMTFLNPATDPLGAGYQIQQSLIAIGSGGLTGRGFGKSIQKFNFLPEPIGDSIFAVAGEEFGFIGSVLLILLFLSFALRGLKIASQAPDTFSGLLVTGIVILITSQSFINIGSMLGVLPLTGTPLLFVSHGGTAMLFALASVGIILNVSKHRKQRNF